MNTIGQRIAFYRKKEGWTQEQLSEKCSVTPQAISKWEKDICAPDIALIPILAEAFHITCDELLGVKMPTGEAAVRESVDLSKTLLKINILSSDGDTVKMNLPVSLAEPILKNINFDGRNPVKDIDLGQIMACIQSGVIGKLLEVRSSEGDVVEIWVES